MIMYAREFVKNHIMVFSLHLNFILTLVFIHLETLGQFRYSMSSFNHNCFCTLCNGKYRSRIYEKQDTSLGERSRRFSHNLWAAGSSPTRDIMVYLSKALKTFTLVTPT